MGPSNSTHRYILKRIFFVHAKSYTFIAALFTLAKRGKQPRCPSVDQRINTACYLHTIEYYYSAIKKNEILIQVTAWMNIENIMLGKRNQKQKVWSRHIYSDGKINDCRGWRGGRNEKRTLMDMESFLGEW